MVTNRTYQRLKDDYATDKWYWTKRVKTLEERVEELEKKNKLLAEDNQMLYRKKETASVSLADAEREIKDLKLKIMSLEARWPIKVDDAVKEGA